MRLYAISDLHLSAARNRQALQNIRSRPGDWLIVAGDVGERVEHLEYLLDLLRDRFRQLVWVPGNHDLWSISSRADRARGEYKYRQLVEVCRKYGVLTPEDPYPVATFGGERVRIVPMFLLYDYSFRPEGVDVRDATEWARASGVMCADEDLLEPDPYPDIGSWCRARCEGTEQRLVASDRELRTVLVNHFPLRRDIVWIPRIPRFSIWCGTVLTEDWHRRFNAVAVVSGHLHIPRRTVRDGVVFHDVSLGYPNQWQGRGGIDDFVREILPSA